MLERITAHDPVWETLLPKEEGIRFHLFLRIRGDDDSLFLTDRKSILYAQTSPKHPAWIWTAGALEQTALGALKEALYGYGANVAVVKPELVPALGAGVRVKERMLANVCPAVIAPVVPGALAPAGEGRVEDVARMVAGFTEEAQHEYAPPEAYRKRAEALLISEDFALWLTGTGEPAACAYIAQRTERLTRINTVYTFPHLRGHGYAGAAVASLCEKTLTEGRTPMLYTDADYPSSNRAYQKVGFVPAGALCQIELGG